MTSICGSRRDFTDCDDAYVLEFVEIAADIVAIPAYQKLKNYRHHCISRYQHSLNVAWYTYRWSRMANLDYVSATRGALLHDFFLYDWRNKEQPIPGRHCEVHPMVALSNAEKYVDVNPVMRDCILHHMWPSSAAHPDTKEGMIVQLADKYCASIEFESRPYRYLIPKFIRAFSIIKQA